MVKYKINLQPRPFTIRAFSQFSSSDLVLVVPVEVARLLVHRPEEAAAAEAAAVARLVAVAHFVALAQEIEGGCACA